MHQRVKTLNASSQTLLWIVPEAEIRYPSGLLGRKKKKKKWK